MGIQITLPVDSSDLLSTLSIREREAHRDDALVHEVQSSSAAEGQVLFCRLVERHQGWLTRHLLGVLGEQSIAEDVAQETFVRAYLNLDRYQQRGSFRGWLRTIATRLAYNQQRDSATRQRYERSYERPESGARFEAQNHAREVLACCFESLSESYREVLTLRHLDGLSVKKVAQHLALSESAAKMRLLRARQAFKSAHDTLV